MNENNQKNTSRVASASANKLYHRILDTSIPRTCSEFACLRDATPHERHICRDLSSAGPFLPSRDVPERECLLVVP